MFILQRYKHYILNQKKIRKKIKEIAKKMKEPGNAVPRLGIMRKKCYFTNLPTMILPPTEALNM